MIQDVLIRAVKTAVQSGLAILAAAGTGYIHIGTFKAAAVAAGAALISAANNALSTPAPSPVPKQGGAA
jgi:hypothetical protein